MRRPPRSTIQLIALFALGLTLGIAREPVADANKRAGLGKVTKTKDLSAAGGTYWRIKTNRGPIYVWIPEGYDRETAGTVIYIHGYHTDVDGAWKNHKLPRQFARSRQNAMFIVPEAPSGNGEKVHWDRLTDLKRAVGRANIRMPHGETVVVAHSGGFRTVQSWTDYKWLTQVILLDAMYGGQKSWKSFIHTSKRAKHRKMVIVASDTVSSSKKFAEAFPYAVIRKGIPSRFSEFKRHEKGTRLLYIRSQYNHGALAGGGAALPMLLRLTPLKRL